MDEYKQNSNKFKEEQKEQSQEKRAEKVVTGKVITKKKSGINKFFSEFFSEDIKNVKSYVCDDVLIPAAKKAISDLVTESVSMLLYGEKNESRKRSTADKISYRNYYDKDSNNSRVSTTGYSYDDIILNTRGEAEDILSRMDELMNTYGLVRVADLYDLVGITGNYTDNKYGWNNIRNANVVRVREGYMIKMPRAIPLD